MSRGGVNRLFPKTKDYPEKPGPRVFRSREEVTSPLHPVNATTWRICFFPDPQGIPLYSPRGKKGVQNSIMLGHGCS
jgi:hypothetical protein